MKRSMNIFGVVLMVLLLCMGVMVTSCEGVNPLGGENTEQGGNNSDENEGEENQPGDIGNDGKAGVMTWYLDAVTEVSATFSGTLAVAASDLSFSQVTVYYSDEETFNINDAQKASTTTFDTNQKFTITITGLKPNAQYNYCLVAEVKSEKTYGDVKKFTTVALVAPTLNVLGITEVSAIISGNVEPLLGTTGNLLYSFQYSKSEDFSSGVERREITNMDTDGNFNIPIFSLVPSQVYYIRSYISMNGVGIFGEVSSFSAAPLVAPSLNEASEITYCDASVSGKVNLLYEKTSPFEFGVQYCTSLDFASDVTTIKASKMDENNNFRVELTLLTDSTTYYYRSYIGKSGVIVYGEKKFFTTQQHPYTRQGYLDFSSALDLSSSGSANCYIVSEPGLYKFKTVKGNQASLVGSVESASILWESFGTSTVPELLDLISTFSYKDGYIAFHTADTFKEGNAVIAAKDASGNILWSWHIWFTDYPEEQVYDNNAGIMMDRNLGATSATPGDVGALGLLYQWGRKDPFLGSSSISDCVEAKSTIAWPSAVSSDSSKGTIEYAIANPTTFIDDNSSNYDWHYHGSLSIHNIRWTTSSRDKSMYDPCPSGWRVPDGGSNGVWSKALGSSSHLYTSLYDSTNKGMNISRLGSSSIIWYPASGARQGKSYLHYVGQSGHYWSAFPFGTSAYSLRLDYSGNLVPSEYESRGNGYSVRCISE